MCDTVYWQIFRGGGGVLCIDLALSTQKSQYISYYKNLFSIRQLGKAKNLAKFG
jgi:hypothetical protein